MSDRWPNFIPNGNDEYPSHSSRYPWSNDSVNRHTAEVQYGAPDYADRCDTHQNLSTRHGTIDVLGADKTAFELPIEDVNPKPASAQFGHSLYSMGTSGASRGFVGSNDGLQINEREDETVSDPDVMDPYPGTGEYILERRRRALILKRTRHQRRVNAAAATKARADLALVRRGGSLHQTKTPEEVRISEKKQRRVSNRDSVERCRKKQKMRLIDMKQERIDLVRENETIKLLLENLDAHGFVFPKKA